MDLYEVIIHFQRNEECRTKSENYWDALNEECQKINKKEK